jgi:hypothetical protein
MSMFSGFHAYDDEGYFLITLKDYLSGQPLLKPAVPIYGPFFYESMGGLFKLLGLEPGHDNGRIVTLAILLIASLLGGVAGYRLTRNLWLGLGAQFLTFSVLSALGNEPMSPSGLVSILLVCLVAVAAFRSERPRATAAVIGAIVGALCLIKINVGAFAAVAVAFAWAGSLTQRWRRLGLPLMALVITVLPPALMLTLLTQDWVLEFAVVVALSAAAVGIACVIAAPKSMPAASGRWFAAGGTILVIACLGLALAGGTRPGDFWDRLVVASLQFPRVFTLPLQLNAGYDLIALLSFAAALAVTVRSASAAPSATAAGLVRVGVGFFTWLSMLLMPSSIFLLALPLAWVATQAPDDEGGDTAGAYSRVLLPALAVLESLQAYPVAGTQLSIAALCLVPVGAITLGDGIRQLRGAGAARRTTVKAVSWVAPAALVINVAVFLLLALTVTAGFTSGAPLRLPGAESIRLPAQQASQLRRLVAEINRDCSSLVTFPGMNSFYIWTAQDPPTTARLEIWWLMLDGNEQESVVQQLAGKPRLCAVKNQQIIDKWAEGRSVPRRPLVDYIEGNFVETGSFGDYQLLVPR